MNCGGSLTQVEEKFEGDSAISCLGIKIVWVVFECYDVVLVLVLSSAETCVV